MPMQVGVVQCLGCGKRSHQLGKVFGFRRSGKFNAVSSAASQKLSKVLFVISMTVLHSFYNVHMFERPTDSGYEYIGQ